MILRCVIEGDKRMEENWKWKIYYYEIMALKVCWLGNYLPWLNLEWGNFKKQKIILVNTKVFIQNWEILSQGASKRRIVLMEELEH